MCRIALLLIGLCTLGLSVRAHGAIVSYCVKKDAKNDPSCLVRRGTIQPEDHAVRLPILSLDLRSGTALAGQATAEAKLVGKAGPVIPVEVQSAPSPPPVEVVVVVEQPSGTPEIKSRRLELLKTQLARIANATTEVSGGEFRLISYGGNVERLSYETRKNASGESTVYKRSPDEAIAELKALPPNNKYLLLNEAVVIGLDDLFATRSDVPQPKLLVVLTAGDSNLVSVVHSAAYWGVLGLAAQRMDIAIDIIDLAQAYIGAPVTDYHVLALNSNGVVRLVDSESALAAHVTSLIQEIRGHQLVTLVAKPTARAASGRYQIVLKDAQGQTISVEAPFVFAAPEAEAPVPLPRLQPEPNNGGSIKLFVFLGLALIVAVGLAVRSAWKILRPEENDGTATRSRAADRKEYVAWLVPLTGPGMFNTVEIPPAGLTVGNSSRYDLYVGLSNQQPVCYRIVQQSGADGFTLSCPPDGTIVMNGTQRAGSITLVDNAELEIGDTKVVFKCCDLNM